MNRDYSASLNSAALSVSCARVVPSWFAFRCSSVAQSCSLFPTASKQQTDELFDHHYEEVIVWRRVPSGRPIVLRVSPEWIASLSSGDKIFSNKQFCFWFAVCVCLWFALLFYWSAGPRGGGQCGEHCRITMSDVGATWRLSFFWREARGISGILNPNTDSGRDGRTVHRCAIRV